MITKPHELVPNCYEIYEVPIYLFKKNQFCYAFLQLGEV